MSKEIVVEVSERTDLGKGASGRMRRSGMVPGIVYGLNVPPFPVLAESRRIEQVLGLETGKNTIFNLALSGKSESRAVMIRDLQRDPVSDRLVHVDFIRVDLSKTVRVKVPVRLVGVPEGVKTEGGILEFVMRQVEVECLPTRIPEHLDVDVSGLHMNQHLSVSDLPRNEGVDILEDADAILCVVSPPRMEEAPVAAAEEAPAAAEPEVIKKGKEASAEEGETK